jgi:hypothetical protein
MTTAPAPHDQAQRLPAGWHVNDELMPASETIIPLGPRTVGERADHGLTHLPEGCLDERDSIATSPAVKPQLDRNGPLGAIRASGREAPHTAK